MDDDIPPLLLRKHPELAAVGEALRQWGTGEQVTARCAKCGMALVVEEVPETGTLVVRCPNGDTYFRAKRGRTTKAPT